MCENNEVERCEFCDSEARKGTIMCDEHLEDNGKFFCDWCGSVGDIRERVIEVMEESKTIFQYHKRCVYQQEKEDLMFNEVEHALCSIKEIYEHYAPRMEETSLCAKNVLNFLDATIKAAEESQIDKFLNSDFTKRRTVGD